MFSDENLNEQLIARTKLCEVENLMIKTIKIKSNFINLMGCGVWGVGSREWGVR